MTEANVEMVLVQIASSGRVHRTFVVDGVVFSAEGCNLDDAGDRKPVDAGTLADSDGEIYCKRCLPGHVADVTEVAE